MSKHDPPGVFTSKSVVFRFGKKGVMQLVLHAQSTFMDLLLSTSTTAHRLPQLHSSETTSYTSDLKAYLQGSPACQFSAISIRSQDQHNAVHILLLRWQLDYCRYRGLRACRSIRRVCISRSFSRSWHLLCTLCVFSTLNNALYRRDKQLI